MHIPIWPGVRYAELKGRDANKLEKAAAKIMQDGGLKVNIKALDLFWR